MEPASQGPPTTPLAWVGRAIGLLSAVTAASIWLASGYGLLDQPALGGASFVVGLMMLFLALCAAAAAWHGHGIALMVLFFTSFFPVGLYVAGTPGPFQIVAVANVGYLLAGLLLWWNRRGQKHQDQGG